MKKYVIVLLLFAGQQRLFAQTINLGNLTKLIAFCDSTKADEILISHKGKILSHWQRTNFNHLQRDTTIFGGCGTPYMYTASMVKSWTGLLIGILIDKGLISDVNDYTCKYIPEWEAGCENQITIRHLLNMTAGLKKQPGSEGVLAQPDMNQYVLNIKPDTLPTIKFSYSNESVQLLGTIIEKATGEKADMVFSKYLLKPMNMDSTTFSKDAAGNVVVYGGCTTTVYNAHKIGLLMLNKGMFEGKRIISEEWINESVTPNSLAVYYGFLWWVDNNSKYRNYAATGDLGQMTIVFPELDLVFVRKQSCDLSPSSRNMSWMSAEFLELISDILKQ